jgi:hypothetical protein
MVPHQSLGQPQEPVSANQQLSLPTGLLES